MRFLLFSLLFTGIYFTSAQVPNFSWLRIAAEPEQRLGADFAVDKAGNSYMVAHYSGSLTIGQNVFASSGPLLDNMDTYLSKRDQNGYYVWAIHITGASSEALINVSCDEAGNVYVIGGSSNSVIVVGTQTLNSTGNTSFLFKVSPSGQVLWLKSLLTGALFGAHMALDGQRIVVGMAYWFSNNVIGANNFTAKGGTDIIVAELDTNGTVNWAKSFGSFQNEGISGLVTTNSGEIFVSGAFTGDLFIDNDTLKLVGAQNQYIAKFTSTGVHLKSVRVEGIIQPKAIAKDNQDNLFICGSFLNSAKFDQQTLTGFDWTAYLAKYDQSLNLSWAGSGNAKYATESYEDVVVDGFGNSYVAATIGGTFVVGTDTSFFNHLTYNDAALLIFDPNGKCMSLMRSSTKFQEMATRIALDGKENVYLTGHFDEGLAFGGFVMGAPNTREPWYIAKLVSPFVGIYEETNFSSTVHLYPNPATEKFNVELATGKIDRIEIFDSSGKRIQFLTPDARAAELNVSSFPRGIYLVKISTEEGTTTRKFVKE